MRVLLWYQCKCEAIDRDSMRRLELKCSWVGQEMASAAFQQDHVEVEAQRSTPSRMRRREQQRPNGHQKGRYHLSS